MGKRIKAESARRPATPPAITPENRENQLIALAYDLVEQRLRDGTASSSETTAILKFGSTKARMEKQMLEQQMELAKAKTESLKSAKKIEELYSEAIDAIRHYQGYNANDED